MIAGVRSALEADNSIEVTGEATSGMQVLPLISRSLPHVVLIDLQLDADGFTYLGRIKEKHPNVKVIIFSSADEPEQIARALESGACAYVTKTIDPGDLAAVIRQAVAGSFFCLGGLVGVSAAEAVPGEAGLSGRETEILNGVARGLSNRAIAAELWLSDQTVKFHLRNIYRKLDVQNRVEAAKYAFDHGLAGAPAPAA